MKNKIGIILIIVGISVIVYGAVLDNFKTAVQAPVLITNDVQTSTRNIVPVDTRVSNKDSGSTNKVSETFNSEASLVIGTDSLKLKFNAGEILFDVLKRLQTNNEISFGGREYSGLGFFIEEINELKPDKGKSLILFINNKKAMVGVSGYKLNNEDLIEFKIEDNY